MATTVRYPIVIWKDHAGMVTGRLLDEDDDGVAVSLSRKDMLQQLSDYVTHLHQDDDYWFEPEFRNPVLKRQRFKVYPEYRRGEKTYASKDPVVLKLPCVTGERESGMFTALLPTMDVAFEYHDEKSFSKLAAHYVRGAARGMSPQQLSRYLPPLEVELDELVVTLKEVKLRKQQDWEMEHLERIADPLTQRRRGRSTRTWEREKEVLDLVDLLQAPRGNVCLVGASGCGKTAILTEAARKVEALKSPTPSQRGGESNPPLFWLTSAGRIIAGSPYLGQWEARFEEAMSELSRERGILCVTNLLELVRVGGSGPESSIAAFLLPALQDGSLRLVAEASQEELEACDRLIPGLVDCLGVVLVEPLSEPSALSLLSNAVTHFTNAEKISFEAGIAETTFELFHRFQPYAAFPGQALSFLERLIGQAHDDRLDFVSATWLREQFARATGLPLAFLSDEQPLALSQVSGVLSRQIIGQPEAVQAISHCLLRFKAGLNDPRRPLGVYLFSGPTGVGKTALVRALGDYLFENKPASERSVRLDMSEYASFDAAARLLGHAHGAPSEFIRQVRAQPFTVLLLDEIEKAADDVFDLFLNVFEEGRLTDAFGRTTSFQSTVIIMTSNLGAEGARTMSFEPDDAGTDPEAIKRFFRPEFFNRLDDVIHFRPLDQEAIEAVARKELAEIAQREGLAARELTLRFTDRLVAELSKAGFDPKLGARPLQRKIEESVVGALANYLLEHQAIEKAQLSLDWANGETVVSEEN